MQGGDREPRLVGRREDAERGLVRSRSAPPSCCTISSRPPTEFTATTASTMTPPIFTTNWKVSVTTTPQRPEKMVYSAVTPKRTERGGPGVDVERDLEDRDHGAGDPAHDDQIDRQGEIERAEAPQHRRRLAAVAQLGELEVGEHARPAPEPGEEEDREDPRDRAVPPEPVAGDAVLGDQAGHHQRRVGREGGGDHRRAGEPPGQRPAGDEVLVQRLAGPPGVDQRDDRRGHEVERDDEPVGELEAS